ncbi:dnaJ homolog subfamily B member 13-like [Ctenocephalides felis]|uniref:dnaJ homolog subfamily B member 13-like n=1 Tax=Ctenocephalides felis TaxID=7515 RepID=UPI000E6E5312|nr:dnaJ homolog subfamily B member 13-like [Ctenocephalides felis]
MGIDYYGVFSLNRTCTLLDIKKKYRQLALALHPLKKPNPPGQPAPIIAPPTVTWELIGEAYEVLSDPLRREIFDQFGQEGLQQGVPTPDGFVPPYVYHGDAMKTYQDFFGSTSPYVNILDAFDDPQTSHILPICRGLKAKDPPIIQPLLLTLSEVFHGGIKKMKIQRKVFIDEHQAVTRVKEKILDIPIKRGILPGTRITFEKEGDQGPTNEAADIIFVITDRPHEVFSRIGAHLVMDVKVGLKDALCGTSVTVHTLDRRIIRIPITTIINPAYEKIVVGEGMPRIEDPKLKGDLIIKFSVTFPTYLPKASKQLIAKAFHTAEQDGGKLTSDNINRLILTDKMNRIALKDRLPKF